MNTKSVEKIRQMQAMTRAQSNDQLITSYLLLVEANDAASRLVRGVVQDELERRIPAIADATEAWVNDLDSDESQEDVVLRVLVSL